MSVECWECIKMDIVRFEGRMKAGKFEGKGTFIFGSLDKYEGDFINGV